MARATPSEAIRLLQRHAFLREQATLAVMNEHAVKARRRATSYWMVEGRSAGHRFSASAPARPDKLTKRTHRLERSVKVVPARRVGERFQWGITAGGPSVPYARIHEAGGRTRAHTIAPIGGRGVLRWQGRDGGVRFARSVRHPGSRIPPRPYIRPAMDEQVRGLARDLRGAYARVREQVFR